MEKVFFYKISAINRNKTQNRHLDLDPGVGKKISEISKKL